MLAVIAAAGCASAPETRYYTLDMQGGGRGVVPVRLEILPLDSIQPLSRGQILIQATPTEIEYYAADRWAAGIEELVARKLEVELVPSPDADRVLYVSGAILDFGQVDVEGGAEACATLRLSFYADRRRETPAVLEKTYAARVAVAEPTAETVVGALSDAVERIASVIAADLKNLS